jgi:general secretion pathway protein M
LSTSSIGIGAPAPGPRAQLEAFWHGRAARERQALAIGGIALLVFLIWLVLVQPAWRTLHTAPVEIDALERQIQQIQASAVEVKALRAVAPVAPPQAAAALKAASDRLGDKARLSLQGDRAVLTVTGVDAEALRSWLTEARSAARARPMEATLSRAAQGYSGTIVVALGGAP